MVLRLRDVPAFPDRMAYEGDHAFMQRAWANGDFARDPMGIISAFSNAHLELFTDDTWTRQLELEGLRVQGFSGGALEDFFSNILLASNGKVHRDRRGALAKSFPRKSLLALRNPVRKRSEALVASLKGRGEIDFVEDFCSPLPVIVMAQALSLPDDEVWDFVRAVRQHAGGVYFKFGQDRTQPDKDLVALQAYIADILERRRANLGPDMLSHYLQRNAEMGILSEAEIRAQIVALVFAGSDTTRGTLAAMLYRFMSNRDQWELLCSDPERYIAGAVAEGLRMDPMVGSIMRVTTTPREVNGVFFPAETFMGCCTLTALRDPSVYKDPNRFDITRTDIPKRHPAYGQGPHRCLGEALANIELEEALLALAQQAPDLRLPDDAPEWDGALEGLGAVRNVRPLRLVI